MKSKLISNEIKHVNHEGHEVTRRKAKQDSNQQ